MILYYSGTGNSRFAAKILATQTGEEPVCMNDIMRDRIVDPCAAKYLFSSEKPFVFVCPTYCWQVPRIVKNFITNSRFEGTKDVYFFLTCGSDTGAAYEHAKAFCEEHELNFKGLGSVKMPENYITLFNSPSYDDAQGIIHAAISQIESAGRIINLSKPLSDYNASNPNLSKINNLFYRFFVNDKKYYATNDCVGCGLCAKICPLANITIEDGEPVWHGNCTQCMACISSCPKNAIEYGRRSKGKRRYYLFINGQQKINPDDKSSL